MNNQKSSFKKSLPKSKEDICETSFTAGGNNFVAEKTLKRICFLSVVVKK